MGSQRRKRGSPRGTLARAPRSPAASAHRAATVLIVDDSADAREVYGQFLRHRGFVTVTAADGNAGIDIAVRLRPDIVVMDLAMPKLNGVSAARQLKHDGRTRDIPIILLTGYAYRAIEHGALEAGVDMFLTKPCLPEDLEGHVRSLLGDRRHRSDVRAV